jgi:hypothetical protein
MADASRRGQPDTVARAAWQVDADDAIKGSAWSVASGIRWAKYGDYRRANGNGQVHRTRIAGDEEIEPLDYAGQRQEVGLTGGVDHVTWR